MIVIFSFKLLFQVYIIESGNYLNLVHQPEVISLIIKLEIILVQLVMRAAHLAKGACFDYTLNYKAPADKKRQLIFSQLL